MDMSDPQQWNGYTYGENNPITNADPTGLKSCSDDRCGAGADYVDHAGNYVNVAGDNDGCGGCSWKKVELPAAPKNKGFWSKIGDGIKNGAKRTVVDPFVSSYNTVISGWTAVYNDTTAVINGDMSLGSAALHLGGIYVGNYKDSVVGLVTAPVHAMDKLTETPGHVLNGDYEKAAESWTEGALTGLSIAAGVKLGTKNKRGCHSFGPATPVLLANGTTKPIGEITTGDVVLATDPDTGVTEPQEVTATHINVDTEFTDLTIKTADGQIRTLLTTPNHRFWNQTRAAWTNAVDLRAGEKLQSLDGSIVEVHGLVSYTARRAMHDLTVAAIHTYYVVIGHTPLLVHNDDDEYLYRGVYFGHPDYENAKRGIATPWGGATIAQRCTMVVTARVSLRRGRQVNRLPSPIVVSETVPVSSSA